MAISKIKTGSITDSAVNTDKLAPGSVGSTDLSATAITGQTELSETAADTDFTIIYDTSAGALKKILRSNLKQAGPTISSISPTNAVEGDGTVTFTITGTGFTAGSSARLIGNLGKIQEFDTVTRTNTTTITSTVAFSSLEQAQEPYDVQVTNGEGISSLLANQINVDASPVFTTSAGSLGTSRFDMNGVEVNATDPDSAGNVTFELQSGALPPGISLTNTGANGGTATFTGTITAQSSDTVFNFTLRAVDAASNTTSRAFSFTALGPSSTSFTADGTFSIPTGATAVDVLVVAGGGAGAQRHGGGGGAGGLIFMPDYPVTPGGTVTVTVGEGDDALPKGSGPSGNGQDSTFGAPGDPGLGQGGVLTAKGGGPGNECSTGFPGGSGGGGGGPGGCGGGSATQPTQPGNSGAYGFGNAGGSGNGVPGPTATGGGGGGAGAAGGQAGTPNANRAGPGGTGKAYTIADGTTPVGYAGGGGGGAPGQCGGQTGYAGSIGGGGAGGTAGNTAGPGAGRPGTANRGGGGGGAAEVSEASPNYGGTGGKGIVIVRF